MRTALKDGGTDVLPLVLVDGRIVAEGAYPSRETLAALAGIRLTKKLLVVEEASSCCSDDDDDDDDDDECCSDEDGKSCC